MELLTVQDSFDFNNDGTKVYIVDDSLASVIYFEYSFSTAWDISSAELASDSLQYTLLQLI